MKRGMFLLAACLALASCGGLFKEYGRIDPAPAVEEELEAYRLRPEYRYYISGSDVYPNALMALRRDLRLDPRTLWKEVEMSPGKMREIVEAMKKRASQVRQFQYGFEIKDDKSRPIGMWYSLLWAATLVRMNEDGTVRIDTPELDVYEKLERDGGSWDSSGNP